MISPPRPCPRCGCPAESVGGEPVRCSRCGWEIDFDSVNYLDWATGQAAREVVAALVDANMDLSKAARLLYVHRNTVLYRIEKIKQATGYDCTDFRQLAELWSLLGGK